MRLTHTMRATVCAPRGRCPDRGDGSPLAGRYLVHGNSRTLRALVELGLAERVHNANGAIRAYVLTSAGELLRGQS